MLWTLDIPTKEDYKDVEPINYNINCHTDGSKLDDNRTGAGVIINYSHNDIAEEAGYFTIFGSRGGILKSRRGIRFFTNNMIFLECGVIALFEAFYMLRDHNHVKMKFWNVKWRYLILCPGKVT